MYKRQVSFGIVNASNPRGGTQTQIGASQIGGAQSDQQGLQTYYLDLDFTNPTDTKVTLSRPAVTVSRTLSLGASTVTVQVSGSVYPGKGSTATPIELEHSIDPYGVLQCVIPPSFKFTSMTDGGFGLGGYRYQFEVSEKSLIKLITALHVNLGNYSRVSLRGNRYYRSRVEQALSYYDSELQIAQDNPAQSVFIQNGVTVSDLQDLREELTDYAYDAVETPFINSQSTLILDLFENTLPGTSRFSIHLFNPAFYSNLSTWDAAINNYIQNSLLLSPISFDGRTAKNIITDSIQSTDYVGTIIQPDLTDTNLFTEVPPHLINIRISDQKIELLSIQPSDPNSGPGTPAAGNSIDGINYNIFYTPLQDSNEGNYIPSSQD